MKIDSYSYCRQSLPHRAYVRDARVVVGRSAFVQVKQTRFLVDVDITPSTTADSVCHEVTRGLRLCPTPCDIRDCGWPTPHTNRLEVTLCKSKYGCEREKREPQHLKYSSFPACLQKLVVSTAIIPALLYPWLNAPKCTLLRHVVLAIAVFVPGILAWNGYRLCITLLIMHHAAGDSSKSPRF